MAAESTAAQQTPTISHQIAANESLSINSNGDNAANPETKELPLASKLALAIITLILFIILAAVLFQFHSFIVRRDNDSYRLVAITQIRNGLDMALNPDSKLVPVSGIATNDQFLIGRAEYPKHLQREIYNFSSSILTEMLAAENLSIYKDAAQARGQVIDNSTYKAAQMANTLFNNPFAAISSTPLAESEKYAKDVVSRNMGALLEKYKAFRVSKGLAPEIPSFTMNEDWLLMTEFIYDLIKGPLVASQHPLYVRRFADTILPFWYY